MTVLFFGSYPADSVGIDKLSVGCDQSLDEHNPIVRLRGEDSDGGELFDHHALCMSGVDARRMAHAVGSVLEGLGPHNSTVEKRDDLSRLLARLKAISDLDFERQRIEEIVGRLKPGEMFRLGDEGGTVIESYATPGGHSNEFVIRRWGNRLGHEDHRVGACGQTDSVSKAVAIALGDYGLPRTEPVVDEPGPEKYDRLERVVVRLNRPDDAA